MLPVQKVQCRLLKGKIAPAAGLVTLDFHARHSLLVVSD